MYEIKYRRLSEMAKDQTRNQHYIPRFYLKEFATNDTYGKKGKEQVYIYDKKSEKSEPRNIKKIAKIIYILQKILMVIGQCIWKKGLEIWRI